MPFQVKSKVAIITGSAQGFGKEFGRIILRKGGKVCLSDINDEIGEKLFPNCPRVPKLEILFNNILALYNRCHPGFERNWFIHRCPEGYDAESLAANFNFRFRKACNPLDPVEEVQFNRNLSRFPTPRQRL